jgi:hypothetical protein
MHLCFLFRSKFDDKISVRMPSHSPDQNRSSDPQGLFAELRGLTVPLELAKLPLYLRSQRSSKQVLHAVSLGMRLALRPHLLPLLVQAGEIVDRWRVDNRATSGLRSSSGPSHELTAPELRKCFSGGSPTENMNRLAARMTDTVIAAVEEASLEEALAPKRREIDTLLRAVAKLGNLQHYLTEELLPGITFVLELANTGSELIQNFDGQRAGRLIRNSAKDIGTLASGGDLAFAAVETILRERPQSGIRYRIVGGKARRFESKSATSPMASDARFHPSHFEVANPDSPQEMLRIKSDVAKRIRSSAAKAIDAGSPFRISCGGLLASFEVGTPSKGNTEKRTNWVAYTVDWGAEILENFWDEIRNSSNQNRRAR